MNRRLFLGSGVALFGATILYPLISPTGIESSEQPEIFRSDRYRSRGADDPALVPPTINRSPGPEYDNSLRKYQGIPGLARSPDGRLWATWYDGGVHESRENYVMLATSEDDGETWSDIRAVIDPSHEIRVFDATLWVDPAGRLWWFFSQTYSFRDGREGVWSAVANEPDAPNPVWSEPRRIADGVMMNKPIVLKDGTWLLPIHLGIRGPFTDPTDKRRYVPEPYRQWGDAIPGTFVYASTDNGKSFGYRGTAPPGRSRHGGGEHMVIELRNGNLWMLRREEDRWDEAISFDKGYMWKTKDDHVIPHIDSRFFVRRLRSGRLLLVKHNPPLDAPWLSGHRNREPGWHRSHITAYLSDDDGANWYGGLLLDDRPAVSYPDGDEAPDGTIYIIYDRSRRIEKRFWLPDSPKRM